MDKLEWLPQRNLYEQDFELCEDEYEKQTLLGLTVTVREYHRFRPPTSRFTSKWAIGPQVLMQLDAAAAGIAGILAVSLVFDQDDFIGGESLDGVSLKEKAATSDSFRWP